MKHKNYLLNKETVDTLASLMLDKPMTCNDICKFLHQPRGGESFLRKVLLCMECNGYLVYLDDETGNCKQFKYSILTNETMDKLDQEKREKFLCSVM